MKRVILRSIEVSLGELERVTIRPSADARRQRASGDRLRSDSTDLIARTTGRGLILLSPRLSIHLAVIMGAPVVVESPPRETTGSDGLNTRASSGDAT